VSGVRPGPCVGAEVKELLIARQLRREQPDDGIVDELLSGNGRRLHAHVVLRPTGRTAATFAAAAPGPHDVAATAEYGSPAPVRVVQLYKFVGRGLVVPAGRPVWPLFFWYASARACWYVGLVRETVSVLPVPWSAVR
jgi:hypothetical protein